MDTKQPKQAPTCVTRSAISLQPEAGGASAGGAPWVGQTEVTAAPIVLAAAVDVGLNSIDLHGMDVHDTRELLPNDGHIGTRVFVGSLDSTGL